MAMWAGVLVSLVASASAGVLRLPVHRAARVPVQRDSLASPLGALQSLAASALGSTAGSQELVLGNEWNNAYYAEVQIGTPGQTLLMLLDTGSANLWVPAKKRHNLRQSNHSFYDPGQSSTYVPTGTDFEIEYGSGDASGVFCQDTITVGGLVLPNFTFANVHHTGGLSGWKSSSWDGILGLGFQSNAIGNVSTVMKELVASGQLDAPVFGFYLGDNAPGQLVVGGVDAAHVVGDFHHVDVSSSFPWPGQWAVDLDSVKVGADLVLLATRHAMVDSGSSLISGPRRDVQAIAAMIGAYRLQDVYAVPCQANATVSFSIGGKDFELELDDLTLDRQGDVCRLGLEGSDLPTWVLGDVFMRKFYIKFDWGQKRMGLARAASTQNLV